MRLCFVINRILSGGAQNTLKSVAEGISNKGNKIDILAFEKKNKKDVNFEKKIKVNYLNKRKINSDIINFFLFIFFMIKEYKKFDYIISTGDAQTIIICRLVCLIFRKKHIPWIQFHYKTSKPKNIFNQIIWYSFFKFCNYLDHKVITCSKYIDKAYVKNFGWKNTKVILQCINPKFIDNCIDLNFIKKIKKKNKNTKIILAPGRIDKDKNHLTILKAINLLVKKREDFILIIHGEKGNNYNIILDYIVKNKLDKFVIIVDLIRLNEFINWLVLSDLVILNSIQEPIGTIAFENMYLKTNFLISYQTGWKEIITNKKFPNVILNPYNEQEIFNKIKKILKKPLSKTLKSSYHEFILKYKDNNISEKWIQFIKQTSK